VPAWVTVFGQVNHLRAEPGTLVYSAWAIPPWVGRMSTQWKLPGTSRDTEALQCELISGCGLGIRDQRRHIGTASALEACQQSVDEIRYAYNWSRVKHELHRSSVSSFSDCCCCVDGEWDVKLAGAPPDSAQSAQSVLLTKPQHGPSVWWVEEVVSTSWAIWAADHLAPGSVRISQTAAVWA